MLEFPQWLTIPLADWVEAIMDWVQATLGGFFNVIGDLVLSGVYGALSISLDIKFFYWRIPAAGWAFLILALAVLLVAAAAFITWRMTHKIKLVTMLTVALVIIIYITLFGLRGIENFLLWLPWWLVVAVVGYAAWRVIHKWWAGLLAAAGMIIIGSFRFGSIGYWDLAMETLAIIITSVIISLVIGIPIGILIARSDRIESLFRPLLDAMQTMPSFVYLIPVMMLFSLGKVPAVFATIIYAMPPVIRLTNTGIRQVPQSVIEAAQAFGSSARQTLLEVQLPLAIPSIIVGINQTTMMALAMVVIASMV
ncbi:MAG: ABC transporter permease subunit, partial [Dehalococcoidales bacterium]|nr:ABC transporter permease subunit [Dehalococcoidales bacterium]